MITFREFVENLTRRQALGGIGAGLLGAGFAAAQEPQPDYLEAWLTRERKESTQMLPVDKLIAMLSSSKLVDRTMAEYELLSRLSFADLGYAKLTIKEPDVQKLIAILRTEKPSPKTGEVKFNLKAKNPAERYVNPQISRDQLNNLIGK